jgi:tetratricopeptide (TPR) repeat protein
MAMAGTRIGRWSSAICAVVFSVTVFAAPAWAQNGTIKGKVVDAQNKPVEGAKVTLVHSTGGARTIEMKSNKKGEFIQVGVTVGNYTITAEKDGMTQAFPVTITNEPKEVNFTLKAGAAAADVSKDDAKKHEAKVAAIQAKFGEGVALKSAGKYDEAIAKFTEILTDVPKCPECYTNIAAAYVDKKEYDKAEESFKKALEINPDFVDAYNGLATMYNSQQKFKEAQEMSAEAVKRSAAAPGGGGGNAEALYNQGVIAWNAKDVPKAQEHFTAALAADPKYAEAHFMLGKVFLNTGKLPEAAKEFETYTKVAPNGPNAKEAQSNFELLKPYIK